MKLTKQHQVPQRWQLKTILGLCLLVFQFAAMSAEDKDFDKGESVGSISKFSDISDRAAGTHNGSNIGLFFENRGKLYPRSSVYGPSGEFPINSGRDYIWCLNPIVAVAPDAATGRGSNVIQSYYTSNVEWEAVGGFHNPGSAEIAFSDQPATWPSSLWFFQDAEENPIIVSTQDSYCVYNDANNTVAVLGIQIAQTGYAFGLPVAEDLLVFKFEITNQSAVSYDSVYFALYMDFDIGNLAGGDAEHEDDMIAYDPENNFIVFYDTDHYSADWAAPTGIMGITLLESPLIAGHMAGITDMHINRLSDDDDLLMTIISSNLEYLPTNVSADDFFRPGAGSDPHIDDPGEIPPGGEDVRATISSGPFNLAPLDTLTFVTCIVAGVNEADLYQNLAVAQDLYAKDFVTSKPPLTPSLSGVAGNNQVTLYWSATTEGVPDGGSGIYDFEGYNLYRSTDRGMSWDQIDRNEFPETGAAPIALASFDRVNGIGADRGIPYTYTDDMLINGFEYWYSLTAFDQGDSLMASLESPIGNTTKANNIISLIPLSRPAAYLPAEASEISHQGAGRSNYLLNVEPVTLDQLSSFEYEFAFSYTARYEIGNPGLVAVPVIVDSSLTPYAHYWIEFTSVNTFDIYEPLADIRLTDYPLVMGFDYPLSLGLSVRFESVDSEIFPSPGDLLSLNFCADLVRYSGLDTLVVMNSQKFDPAVPLVSDDGLFITLDMPDLLQNIITPPILDFNIDFVVVYPNDLLDADYQLTIIGSGFDDNDNPYLVVRTAFSDSSIIHDADTLYNSEYTYFKGINAVFSFDEIDLPPVGSTATLTSLQPRAPTLQDRYTFGVVDGRTHSEELVSALDEIRVVPNPYMVGSLWEQDYGSFRREPERQIQFINLPAECDITIFTLAGDEIKSLEHRSTNGTEIWDLRAEGGREIVAGIYLYQVKSKGFEYFNRFAVIK